MCAQADEEGQDDGRPQADDSGGDPVAGQDVTAAEFQAAEQLQGSGYGQAQRSDDAKQQIPVQQEERNSRAGKPGFPRPGGRRWPAGRARRTTP
jgi:hypothetical protein